MHVDEGEKLIRLCYGWQFMVWFDNGQFLMGFSLTLNHEEVLLTYLFCRLFRPKLHVKNSVSYIGGTILIN